MVNKKTTTIKELLKQRQKQITSGADAEVQNTNNNSSNKFNLVVKKQEYSTSKAGLEVKNTTTNYLEIQEAQKKSLDN